MSNANLKLTSRHSRKRFAGVLCIAALATIVTASTLLLRADSAAAQAKGDTNVGTRLHLEITGGDPATPVEGASVYLRYLVKHKMSKDENVEMNLKTGHDGTVVVPFVPRGDVTIQIVAERWKPYGQKFQMTDEEQTIKIHLDKPPKWY
nr:hypothetical protein [Candidatus Acidoferrales bacterium]